MKYEIKKLNDKHYLVTDGINEFHFSTREMAEKCLEVLGRKKEEENE